MRKTGFILLLFTQTVMAQEWQPIPLVSQEIKDRGQYGGEGCQFIQAVECDHQDGNFLLMGTDVGGIYRSLNGGELWEPCNTGYFPRGNCGFAIDPNNSTRALAIGANSLSNQSHGIYLTTDTATTWTHVLALGNYSGYRSYKDKVAFDKSSFNETAGYSEVAYWSSPAGGIYKSLDGGENWTRINTSYGDCILKVDPGDGTVYIANDNGFYRSTDGGINFVQTFSGLVRDMALSQNDPSRVWITTAGSLYFSEDKGLNFTKIAASWYPSNVISLAVSPVNNDHMVICQKNGDWELPVYYSVNGGLNWKLSSRNHQDAFMPFNGRPQEFAWHPLDENRVWALGGDWITSSEDAGQLFSWDSNGFNGILMGGLMNFNVFNPDLIYVGSQDYNGAVSFNGGDSWKYCNASGEGWGGFTYGAYAASEDVLVTQVSEGWGADGILTMSFDGGKNFTKTGLLCTGMDVGNGDPKNPDVIYFSNWKSSDLGKNWTEMKDCKGVLTVNLTGEKEVYGANGNKVLRSDDLGENWKTILILPANISDIAIDHELNRLYVVTEGNRLFSFQNEQLEELTSWIPTDQYGNRSIQSVATDPAEPEIVYVAGAQNTYSTDVSVVRSRNAGLSWEILTKNSRMGELKPGKDGARESFAIRVNPQSRELWAAGGCYGLWKIAKPEGNESPWGWIKNPTTSYTDIAPAVVSLQVFASDDDGIVEKVEYYTPDSLIGTSTSQPFSLNWNISTPGTHQVYAILYDNQGSSFKTRTIPFTIIGEENKILKVAEDSYLVSGGEADHNFNDDSLLIIQHISAGEEKMAVLKFDLTGLTPPVKAVLQLVPVAGGTGLDQSRISLYYLPDNSWSEESICWNNKPSLAYLVDELKDFRLNYSREKDVSHLANTAILGDSQLSFLVSGLSDGEKYSISLASLENQDSSAHSRLVVAQAEGKQYPGVYFTEPGLFTEIGSDGEIRLRGKAWDNDGSITKIELYEGSRLLKTFTGEDFDYTWKPAKPGSTSFFARVTDNEGLRSSSARMNVSVGYPPEVTYWEDFNDNSAQGWLILGGTWEAVNGLFNNPSTGSMERAVYDERGFRVYSFSSNLKPIWGNNSGLIFNYQDPRNYLILEMDAFPRNAWLKKVEDGNTSVLSTAAYTGGGQNTWSRAEIRNYGVYTTVLINNQVVFDMVKTPVFYEGKIGLFTDWNPNEFDQVEVRETGNTPPEVNIISPENDAIFGLNRNESIVLNGSDSEANHVIEEIYINNSLYKSLAAGSEFTWKPTVTGEYTIFAKILDVFGESGYSDTIQVKVVDKTGYPEGFKVPVNFEIYPNPALESLYISFMVSAQTHVQIEMIDMNGRVLGMLSEGNFTPGNYTLPVDLSDLNPSMKNGLYILQFRSNEMVQRKILMLKGK